MKNKRFLLLLFVLTLFSVMVSGFASASTVAENLLFTCGDSYGVGDNQSFSSDGFYNLDNLKLIAKNNFGYDTSMRVKIYSDDSGSPDTLLYTSDYEDVTKNFREITFQLGGTEIAEDEYWIITEGNIGISFYAECTTTDTYTDGGINALSSPYDLYFRIFGVDLGVESLGVIYDFTPEDYQKNFQYSDMYSTSNYFLPGNDLRITEINVTHDVDSVESRTDAYLYIDKFNYTNCNIDFLNQSGVYDYDACWITEYTLLDDIFQDSTGRKYNKWQGNITLDGSEVFRVRLLIDHFFAGTTTGHRFMWNTTFNGYINESFLGSSTYDEDFQTFDYRFDSDPHYMDIEGQYLPTCSGDFCTDEETNETEQDFTDSPVVEDGEVNNVFGDTVTDENKNKVTLGGLFISMLIVIFISISAYTYSKSNFILLSVMFKTMFICVSLYWLPFYIPLIILILMIGWKIFDRFVLNGGKD